MKYIDFGLAIEITHGELAKPERAGTDVYMSPEIAARQPYSHNTDVWSLGVVFFQVCAALRHRIRQSS